MADAARRPHREALRKGRRSVARTCYFVTSRAARRGTDVLIRGEAPWIIIEALRWLHDAGRIRLMGYCVMPDHLHFLMVLLEGSGLTGVMHSFGSFTGHRIVEATTARPPVWDEGYHDHAIRNEREFRTRLAYMHDNPVRAGLVGQAEEWPYSTAHEDLAHDIDWAWWEGVERGIRI